MSKKARMKILEKLAQKADVNNLDNESEEVTNTDEVKYSDIYLNHFLANWKIKGLDY